MPFTDRFIKVPIQTYNAKDAELKRTKNERGYAVRKMHP
jgi:hypothetical protein